jgi:hypothetical protein
MRGFSLMLNERLRKKLFLWKERATLNLLVRSLWRVPCKCAGGYVNSRQRFFSISACLALHLSPPSLACAKLGFCGVWRNSASMYNFFRAHANN